MFSDTLIFSTKSDMMEHHIPIVFKGKLCRYKSVKDFEEMKYFKLAFVRAVTFNGDKIPMSRKAYEMIKEQCIQRRK